MKYTRWYHNGFNAQGYSSDAQSAPLAAEGKWAGVPESPAPPATQGHIQERNLAVGGRVI
jgi:hypothetical protein